jgi:hypothetical protein
MEPLYAPSRSMSRAFRYGFPLPEKGKAGLFERNGGAEGSRTPDL